MRDNILYTYKLYCPLVTTEEKYERIERAREYDAVLLVYDLTDRESFNSFLMWFLVCKTTFPILTTNCAGFQRVKDPCLPCWNTP